MWADISAPHNWSLLAIGDSRPLVDLLMNYYHTPTSVERGQQGRAAASPQ
jgi:hypothetical protein